MRVHALSRAVSVNVSSYVRTIVGRYPATNTIGPFAIYNRSLFYSRQADSLDEVALGREE